MNMLLIICPEARQEELRALIHRHGVHAYTELTNIVGEGQTGKKMGTFAHPEKSVLVFIVLEEARQVELLAALRQFQAGLYPGEGLRVFVLPVTEAV